MKIGIDIRLIGKKQTGSEAVFFNLVKNLAEMDNSNQYFLFTDHNPEKDKDLKVEIEKLNLKDNFEIIFVKKTNRFCWNFWYLPNYLRKNPVGVFHTQYIAPFWLPKNVKLVLTIHDISFNYFPEYIKKTDLFFLKTLIPRSIRRADKIITVSESEKKNIVDFYKIPPEKVACAYNGVDFERFSRAYSAEEKENIRKKYTLPEKFLLYIGTLQPRKNIPAAIEALKDLNISLILAGNRNAHNFDPKIDETIEKNNLADKVAFPGWIDEKDKPALLQMAACFVFTTV
ncbi:MAG: glycosyltransferase family 1 protein, partial [Candidatus Moranbacteria bacterium]|nr:glycosyltransferase family 1 protein [Candidatus Moranbacteria bacterium]